MRTLAACTALLAVAAGSAHADQTAFSVQRGPARWTFDVAWTDADAAPHRARFDLPGDGVRADLDQPLRLRLRQVANEVAQQVREAASDMPGVDAKVRVTQVGGININVTARNKAQVTSAMAQLAQVRDQAWQQLLTDRGYTRLDDDITPDHARHVAQYAPQLAPVVAALGGPGDSPRAFADRALAFVQSIPYEERAKVSDRYRRPLSVLGRNLGDCDSKTVLFLSLMRQAWPDTPLAIAYIEGHAFGLAALDRQKGDVRLRAAGRKWVALEPVGPGLARAGELSSDRKKAFKRGWSDTRVVP